MAVELPFTLMHPKPKEEPPHREGEWDLWVTGVGVSREPTPFSTSCCVFLSPHLPLGQPAAQGHPSSPAPRIFCETHTPIYLYLPRRQRGPALLSVEMGGVWGWRGPLAVLGALSPTQV